MDIQVSNHGSIVLVRPATEAAKDWLNENVGDDAQWFGGALVCEPRYVGDLIEGMTADGLEIA